MNGIIEGAAAAEARLVYGDNLYAYGPVDGPIREDLPYRPVGPNTTARAEVASTFMNAHASGKVRATIGRASDFYGAHARQSKAGDGIFARALGGKPAQLIGNPDTPHTLTFNDDFGAALVTLSQEDKALGEVWHVPNPETVSIRRFVEMVFQQLQKPQKLQEVPMLVINLLGLVVPPMAAVKETMYQSVRPWVVDHSKYVAPLATSPRLTKWRSLRPSRGSAQVPTPLPDSLEREKRYPWDRERPLWGSKITSSWRFSFAD